MGGWTGTFMATFLVHTQVRTSSIPAIALINVWKRLKLCVCHVVLLCTFHIHSHVTNSQIAETVPLQMCVYECVDTTDLCSFAHPFGECILWGICSSGSPAGWHTATRTLPPGTHLHLCVDTNRKLRHLTNVGEIFFSSPTCTLLLKNLCGWIFRCCWLLPVSRWTLSKAVVSVSG